MLLRRSGGARRGVGGVALAAARALSSKPVRTAAHPLESFLNAGSANYVDEMYEAWRADPSSVHKSWQVFFRDAEAGVPAGGSFVPPPTLATTTQLAAPAPAAAAARPAVPTTGAVVPLEPLAAASEHSETMKVVQLVRAYQNRGHNIANLDPLGVYDADLDGSIPPELDLDNYGFTEADMDKEFNIGAFMASGFMNIDRPPMKLRDLLARLEQTYAGSIGVEYMHIPDREQLNWLREHFETPEPFSFSKDEKLRMLDRLTWGDHFESFLANKFSAVKRFGVEGGESLIPGMKAMVDEACEHGIEAIVMGMPHRGRLNVLANVVRKPFESIFGEFQVRARARGVARGGWREACRRAPRRAAGGRALTARRAAAAAAPPVTPRARAHARLAGWLLWLGGARRASSRRGRRTTGLGRATSSTTSACRTRGPP